MIISAIHNIARGLFTVPEYLLNIFNALHHKDNI